MESRVSESKRVREIGCGLFCTGEGVLVASLPLFFYHEISP